MGASVILCVYPCVLWMCVSPCVCVCVCVCAQWTDQVFVSPPLTNNYTDTTTNGSSLPSWGYNTGWMVFYNRTDEQGLSWNASTVNALSTLVKPDRCVLCTHTQTHTDNQMHRG